ncbi:hypothetical protein VBJFXLJN_CDS_0082 [Pseudomonas phage TIVP-H6]
MSGTPAKSLQNCRLAAKSRPDILVAYPASESLYSDQIGRVIRLNYPIGVPTWLRTHRVYIWILGSWSRNRPVKKRPFVIYSFRST